MANSRLKYLIITPSCNEEKFLPNLIQSIVNQTVLPCEWIIVDDGDDPVGDLFKGVECVKYFRVEKKMKLGRKRNFMHSKSKGEIIDNILKGGTLIINRDDKFFNYFKKRAYKKKLKVVSFGISQKSDVFPRSILKKKSITKLILKISDQVLNLEFKDLNIYNVLSSMALLSVLNLNLNKALLNDSKKP